MFNALSGADAAAANYPFCTIEPNRGIVVVPDSRLDRLAERTRSPRTIPTTIEFVDIAGLVAGASRGEGLGNAFLGRIRQVDAIVHVVRCFEDDNVAHVAGRVDPRRDIEIIDTELLLKDFDTVEKSVDKAAKQAKGGDRKVLEQHGFYKRLALHLGAGSSARSFALRSGEERSWMQALFLLSNRPVLYAANVSEADLPNGNEHADVVREIASAAGARVMVIGAEFEAQLSDFDPSERAALLQTVGLARPGLGRLIRAAYELLALITFFTHGPKETRAWTVVKGAKAPEAAGRIHTDFERGFIRAETVTIEEFIRLGSEAAVRAGGAMRSEGKEYVVRDGDVILFRFNVQVRREHIQRRLL